MHNRTVSALLGTIAWAAALGMAFPIIWMLITAFKTETQAIASPPLLIFQPVLTSFQTATSGPSGARSSATRRRFCSTNRSPTSMRRWACRCGPNS